MKLQERKGQFFITIPRDKARYLGLRKGDEMDVSIDGARFVIRKMEKNEETEKT